MKLNIYINLQEIDRVRCDRHRLIWHNKKIRSIVSFRI